MLRFAQHDKLGSWIPHFADASVSMTGAVSFRAPFPVIPSTFSCHSERQRGIQCMDASLRSARQSESVDVSLRLRSMQHDGASARYQSIISSIRIFLSEHSLNNVNTT
jgi:hypothetical protein